MYDTEDFVTHAETLVRAKNGSDSAPYEDIIDLINYEFSDQATEVYSDWKAEEIVGWSLRAFTENEALRKIGTISCNVRPSDLSPTSKLFKKVKARINELSPEIRELLLQRVVIEVTEDQDVPLDEEACLQAWLGLGFQLAYDDAIGVDALAALGKNGLNFHTIDKLEPFVHLYKYVKVDIEWAGWLLFLSHPAYAFGPNKVAILEKAKIEGDVYITKGPNLHNTGFKHLRLLEEFAVWAKKMIALRRLICIELSVRQDDSSHKYVLGLLKDNFELDIFGIHAEFFIFQGGLTGAKAFEPALLASSMEA
jgi:hypothetical protein